MAEELIDGCEKVSLKINISKSKIKNKHRTSLPVEVGGSTWAKLPPFVNGLIKNSNVEGVEGVEPSGNIKKSSSVKWISQ